MILIRGIMFFLLDIKMYFKILWCSWCILWTVYPVRQVGHCTTQITV